MSAPVRLALNMPVHLGPKVSVQSYSKVKRLHSSPEAILAILVNFIFDRFLPPFTIGSRRDWEAYVYRKGILVLPT